MGPKAFLPGRMRDVALQGQSHRRGHCATKEAVCAGALLEGCFCPVSDPALTLLSPRSVPPGWLSDSLSSTSLFVLLNINWCSPRSARDRTESPPCQHRAGSLLQLQGPSSPVSTHQRQIQKQKLKVTLSKVPQTAGSRRRGVAWASPAVLMQGGDVAGFSHPRAVHPPRTGVQGRCQW